MLIALAAVFIFAGVWFTALRPKGDAASSPAPAAAPKAPGQQGLENAVGKAQGAVAASESSARKAEAAAGNDAPAKPAATPAKPATATPAKPAATTAKAKAETTTADPSKPLLAQLDKGKTVILLFWDPPAADSRFAYKSVRRADEADGRVVAKSVRIKDVGRYEAVTTGVQVLSSPTVVVIGPDKKAVSRTGYVDRKTVEQLISDSRRKR
ncbi:MAG: hypothetical protein HZB46_15935 [Solirubrobacterales bacterium]|nr:hypothetical protein [Solirubrobacterales bacterium]